MIIPREVMTQFGHCTTVDKARLIIMSHGGKSRIDNGTLVFSYAWEKTPRRVEPIFVNGVGWLIPINEVRPERK